MACGNPLLAASLKSLVDKEEGLEAVMVEAACPEACQALQSFRPHVLILEESATLSQEEIDYVRGQVPTVIRLSLKDTTMTVSHKRQIPAASAQDLLKAIRGRRPALKGCKQRQEGGSGTDPSP